MLRAEIMPTMRSASLVTVVFASHIDCQVLRVMNVRTDRQTDRQIDRQTDRQTDRQIDRQTDR